MLNISPSGQYTAPWTRSPWTPLHVHTDGATVAKDVSVEEAMAPNNTSAALRIIQQGDDGWLCRAGDAVWSPTGRCMVGVVTAGYHNVLHNVLYNVVADIRIHYEFERRKDTTPSTNREIHAHRWLRDRVSEPKQSTPGRPSTSCFRTVEYAAHVLLAI